MPQCLFDPCLLAQTRVDPSCSLPEKDAPELDGVPCAPIVIPANAGVHDDPNRCLAHEFFEDRKRQGHALIRTFDVLVDRDLGHLVALEQGFFHQGADEPYVGCLCG